MAIAFVRSTTRRLDRKAETVAPAHVATEKDPYAATRVAPPVWSSAAPERPDSAS